MNRKTTMTVDDYVTSNVLPEHREIVAILRATVRECAPYAEEVFGYNMPNFTAAGRIFAWLIATKKDITFSFRAGASFEDKFGVLRGVGKHARHIKIKSADSVDRDVLRYYIRQALDLDPN